MKNGWEEGRHGLTEDLVRGLVACCCAFYFTHIDALFACLYCRDTWRCMLAWNSDGDTETEECGGAMAGLLGCIGQGVVR